MQELFYSTHKRMRLQPNMNFSKQCQGNFLKPANMRPQEIDTAI